MGQIDNLQQSQEIIAFLKSYASNPKGFLLFSGKNGTGKTYCAQAVRADCGIHDSDYNFLITQTDLNIKWQKHLNSDDPNAVSYLLNQIRQTKLLVLDDIGTRTPSEAFMDFIYAIIDYRYSNKLSCATIITTNLNAKDMREKFGDAFLSRIGSGKIFKFEGDDRRFTDW